MPPRKKEPEKKAGVPARRTEQAAPQRAGVDIPVEQVTASLIRKHWGKVVDLSDREAMTVAKTIHSSFPMFGPWQIVNHFDILGGSTLYLNANGYMDLAAMHPQSEAPPMLREIKPDSEEWEHWMGETDPKTIAAAFVCEFKRRDRTIPFVEFNYCTTDDSLLYDYKKGSPRKLKPAWPALAAKIARTRAIRRCLRQALSPTEAAAVAAEAKLKGVLERAAARELPRAVKSDEQPYADQPAALPENVELIREDAVEGVCISEQERRRLFAITERLDTDPYTPHTALKMAIAEVRFEQGEDAITVDDVSTKEVTYEQYAEVVSKLHEQYGFKDRETEAVPHEEVGGDQQELL